MNAVSLRQAGGVYFVPESERDSLFRLRQLIGGITQAAGPGLSIPKIPSCGRVAY